MVPEFLRLSHGRIVETSSAAAAAAAAGERSPQGVSPIKTPAGSLQNANFTPYRTPKSVRRGEDKSDSRILGTPDYLVPELLRKQGHGAARDIPWPEGDEILGKHAFQAIDSLLTLDHKERPTAKEVRKMEFLSEFPWDKPEEAVPPFVPKPDDNWDTCYFQAQNIMQHLNVSSCES
ncbi:Similar to MASTL: Serine/threonine-protein kinase greatwall (Homo sapiens) [Cotesia congregata]|uniref:Similar to MASTL: Serine/threonine-protein kinase greatwall (Homo sapiens) n=1 Tax=Cotesia congregata TaxID=51543 RepID=A0A8J2H018_COTCN|nr:Similar to MASTL: Serine/threonine-protein kinase greatwall (Homo sapiens) [Cotesia congregata]